MGSVIKNMEVAAEVIRESPLTRFSERDLQSKLVEYQPEELVYDAEAKRPTLEIVSDHKVAIGGTALKLGEFDIFALNALRLSQGYPMTIEEMAELGFTSDRRLLGITVRCLERALKEISGQPIIDHSYTTESQPSPSFTLLPEVEIVDRRDEKSIMVQKELDVDDGVVFGENNSAQILPNGNVKFTEPRKRAAITLAMIQDFGKWAATDKVVFQLLEERIGRPTTNRPIVSVRHLEPLSRTDEFMLLEKKERALEEYVNLDTFPTERQLATITAGIKACYELFVYNLDTVGYEAARARYRLHGLYADSYQEAAAQMMDSILRQGVDVWGRLNFREIVRRNIRHESGRGVKPLYYKAVLPASFPYSRVKDWYAFKAGLNDIEQQLGYIPNAEAICGELSMTWSSVFGFMAVGQDPFSLDIAIDGLDNVELSRDGLAKTDLIEADFVDEFLDQMAMEESLTELFGNSNLSDSEKIVLSLYYGVFSKSLIGAVIQSRGQTIFAYPDNATAFEEIVDRKYDLTHLSTDLFEQHHEFARRIHNKALRKAKTFFVENPQVFTEDYLDAEDAERQEIIAAALDISPDSRLGAQEIRLWYKTGNLPANEARICQLFGSLPEFQQACGFAPDRGQANSRNMADNEIIALARSLQPDAPLKTGQIRQLSKAKKFVSLQAILNRFGSLPDFQRACGFDV